jgi:Ca-activated chloride channel family protein
MGVAEQAEAAEALGTLELLPAGELSLSVGQRALNLLIIFDTSSSMGENFEGSTKIDVAKRVLTEVVDQMPDGAIVGLRTFSGCHEQSRLLAPVGPIDRAAMKASIQSMEPGGATAIQYVLEQAKLDLAEVAGARRILLVSDGSETCQGNPVAAARALIAAGYDLRIDVVGFDVAGDAAARSQLREIAEVTGGIYFSADSTEQLRAALRTTGPVTYHVFDSGGVEVYTGQLGDAGPRLPAGTYRVVIDTTPPVEVPSVTVQSQQTTQITVSRSDGGYTTTVH